MQIVLVKKEITKSSVKYMKHLEAHPNSLAVNLLHNSGDTHGLKRHKPLYFELNVFIDSLCYVLTHSFDCLVDQFMIAVTQATSKVTYIIFTYCTIEIINSNKSHC